MNFIITEATVLTIIYVSNSFKSYSDASGL